MSTTIGFTKTYLRGFDAILLLTILSSTIYSIRVLLNEVCKFNDFPLYNVNPNTFLSVSAEFTLVQSYYNLSGMFLLNYHYTMYQYMEQKDLFEHMNCYFLEYLQKTIEFHQVYKHISNSCYL